MDEMYSVSNIASGQGVGKSVGVAGVPETGGFDFFQLLLGLQAAQGKMQGGDLLQALSGEAESNATETDNPLLALFKKQDGDNNLSELAALSGMLTPQSGGTKPLETNLTSAEGAQVIASLAEGLSQWDKSLAGGERAESVPLNSLPGYFLMGSETDQAKNEGTRVAGPLSAPGTRPEHLLQKFVSGDTAQYVEAETINREAKPMNSELDLKNVVSKASEGIALPEGLSEVDVEGEDSVQSSDIAPGAFAQIPVSNAKETMAVTAASTESRAESRATVSELFQRVESMVHLGGGKMTVSLTPPQLGHVEIQVKTRGNNVEIEMTSQNSFAKSALESSVHELRQSMQSQDLVLSKLEVNVGREVVPHSGVENFSAFQQGSQEPSREPQNRFDQNRSQAKNAASSLSRIETSLVAATAAARTPQMSGRVDLRI